MTPQQQSALEVLAGRPLTEQEVGHADARNDGSLAAGLSVGRTRLQSKEIGAGTILAILAPDGGAFLDALTVLGESDRNVFWSLDLIRQGRFDIGMPAARAQVTALGVDHPELAPAVASLLALGVVPDSLPVDVVSAILNGGPA